MHVMNTFVYMQFYNIVCVCNQNHHLHEAHAVNGRAKKATLINTEWKICSYSRDRFKVMKIHVWETCAGNIMINITILGTSKRRITGKIYPRTLLGNYMGVLFGMVATLLRIHFIFMDFHFGDLFSIAITEVCGKTVSWVCVGDSFMSKTTISVQLIRECHWKYNIRELLPNNLFYRSKCAR